MRFRDSFVVGGTPVAEWYLPECEDLTQVSVNDDATASLTTFLNRESTLESLLDLMEILKSIFTGVCIPCDYDPSWEDHISDISDILRGLSGIL